MIARMPRDHVYAVHATKPDGPGAVEVVFDDEELARKYGLSRSLDHRVLATSVTSYVIGQLGTRRPVAWYVNGREQDQRKQRPGQFYPTDGGAEGS
jgi:hypothetical protein